MPSKPRDDTKKRVLLICHLSERSEVKRSRESMDCHVANAPRNDELLRGAGDPLTQGAGAGHPERDDG
ncbi:MAG: hypothetical protein NC218_12420 [Acetobacter sp.]|nr:hypothetical protein [Acetobacter sp.]